MRNVRECDDSNIPGEVPHEAEPRRTRCEFHRRLRDNWTASNRKRRQPGGRKAPIPWQNYVRPRPERLRVAVGRETVDDITRAVAGLATARAPVDGAVRGGIKSIDANSVTRLLDAVDILLEAIGPLDDD